MIGRGIGIGLGVFAVLSALCVLTPLRAPLLAVAGREIPALEYRLQVQRDSMDALQMRSSDTRLSPAERAALDHVQSDYVATRERLDARARMNARLTLLGIFAALQELFPWLLAFGLALPVFGGLIGAQVQQTPKRRAPVPVTPPADFAPPSVPLDRPRVVVPPVTTPTPPPPPRPVRPAYVHPAAAAATPPATPPASAPPAPVPSAPSSVMRPLPGSPVVLPESIVSVPVSPSAPPTSSSVETPSENPSQDWGFRHQPTPLESRPRNKLPPVRSPHVLDDASAADDETLPAS